MLWSCGSVEWVWFTQGVEGADGRLYVLDLFRLLPPDANYADCEFVVSAASLQCYIFAAYSCQSDG